MSKSFRNIGILLASTCGVLTAYAAWRPALEERQAERLGHGISSKEKAYGTVISDQMREDFREAEKEWKNEGGFAWGIRQVLFGRNPYGVVKKEGGQVEQAVRPGSEVKESRREGEKG